MNQNISVIIPTYNRALTIKRAIDSVLNQTYPVLEILVCDDGSSDNTEKIVKSINDQRIKWLPSNNNSGHPSVPRNRGIKAAQGDWLAFLDSDDEWLSEKIEKQMADLLEKNLKAGSTNAWRMAPDGNHGFLLDWQLEKITFGDLLTDNYVITSSAIVHRDVINEINSFFPESKKFKNSQDYAFWFLAAAVTDFAYLADGLVNYSDDPTNSHRRNNKISFHITQKRVFKNFIKTLDGRNEFENKIAVCRQAIGHLNRQIFNQQYNIIKNKIRNLIIEN